MNKIYTQRSMINPDSYKDMGVLPITIGITIENHKL
jgi:hypothetical protein